MAIQHSLKVLKEHFGKKEPEQEENDNEMPKQDHLWPTGTTDKELVGWVNNRYDKLKKIRLKKAGRWARQLAFYRGNQWIQPTDKTEGRLVPIEDDRVQVVHNVLKPFVLRVVAYISSEHPIPVAYNADGSPAHQANLVLKANHVSLQKTKIDRRCLTWSAVCGPGIWKTTWDKKAPSTIPKYTNGQMGRTQALLGNVRIEAKSPFSIMIDPTATVLEDAAYLLDCDLEHVDRIQEKYGVKVKSENISDLQWLFFQGLEDNDGVDLNDGEMTIVKEAYIRPCSQYPKGAMITTCGDKLLDYQVGLPVAVPYSIMNWVDSLVDPLGDGTVEPLIGPQMVRNKFLGQIIEHKDGVIFPAILDPTGQIDKSQWGKPRAVIPFNPALGPPQIMQIGSLSNDAWRLMEVIDRDMQDISSQHEIMMGGVPPNVGSGYAINALKEGDMTVMGLPRQSYYNAKTEQGTTELALLKKYAIEPRLYTTKEDLRTISTPINGKDIIFDNLEVELEPGAGRSAATRLLIITQLWKDQIIPAALSAPDPKIRAGARMVMEQAGIPFDKLVPYMEKAIAEYQLEQQAQMQIQQQLQQAQQAEQEGQMMQQQQMQAQAQQAQTDEMTKFGQLAGAADAEAEGRGTDPVSPYLMKLAGIPTPEEVGGKENAK
jgi:hypothetical protein